MTNKSVYLAMFKIKIIIISLFVVPFITLLRALRNGWLIHCYLIKGVPFSVLSPFSRENLYNPLLYN